MLFITIRSCSERQFPLTLDDGLSMNKKAFLIFVSLCMLTPSYQADAESRFGTLGDGTPYRIDAEGNQVIDRLAYLESRNRTLERQIEALENDLIQKESLLLQCSQGKQIAFQKNTIKETTLVEDTSIPANSELKIRSQLFDDKKEPRLPATTTQQQDKVINKKPIKKVSLNTSTPRNEDKKERFENLKDSNATETLLSIKELINTRDRLLRQKRVSSRITTDMLYADLNQLRKANALGTISKSQWNKECQKRIKKISRDIASLKKR